MEGWENLGEQARINLYYHEWRIKGNPREGSEEEGCGESLEFPRDYIVTTRILAEGMVIKATLSKSQTE